MKIEDGILLNKYGQGLIELSNLQQDFSNLDVKVKRQYLGDLSNMIIQSKPADSDIKPAILASGLKDTFTPCVLLSKGLIPSNLGKIINLPEGELTKALLLFLNLFKIAYQRRYEIEKNNPNKWWYWDLSDNEKLQSIKRSTSL